MGVTSRAVPLTLADVELAASTHASRKADWMPCLSRCACSHTCVASGQGAMRPWLWWRRAAWLAKDTAVVSNSPGMMRTARLACSQLSGRPDASTPRKVSMALRRQPSQDR